MATVEHGASPDFQRFLATLGTLVETHASWVVLTESEAIKFKKPVDFGFLDFSTREKREAFCQAELRLNRRLAGSVYRAVLPVYWGRAGYVLGTPESDATAFELVDHAVVMRRLSDCDRADVLLRNGQLTSASIRRLAERLVRFHQGLSSDPALAHFGSASSVAANVHENWSDLEEKSAVDGSLWAPLRAGQQRFLEKNAHRLDERSRGGHVKDGHGDLRLEHVYFEAEEVVIVDCIEFSDRFRFADTALDLAFLSMDLRHAGRSDLAEDLLAQVARASGDFDAYSVLDFYESYRATVRGKVAAFRASQCEGDEARRQTLEMQAFFEQAATALMAKPTPRLVCMSGLVASGKSTLSQRLSGALHCPVIDSDGTRKRMHGVDALTSLADEPFKGAYDAEATNRTYALLEAGARAVLESGRTVIVDASLRERSLRARFAKLASLLGISCFLVECHAPPEVIAERLAQRARGPSRSDGRANMLDAFVAAWEPIEESEMAHLLRCDTSQPGDAAFEEVWRFVRSDSE